MKKGTVNSDAPQGCCLLWQDMDLVHQSNICPIFPGKGCKSLFLTSLTTFLSRLVCPGIFSVKTGLSVIPEMPHTMGNVKELPWQSPGRDGGAHVGTGLWHRASSSIPVPTCPGSMGPLPVPVSHKSKVIPRVEENLHTFWEVLSTVQTVHFGSVQDPWQLRGRKHLFKEVFGAQRSDRADETELQCNNDLLWISGLSLMRYFHLH